MSDPEGLLDTSALLALHGLHDPALLPDVPLISAITLAELSVGPLLAEDEGERARRLLHVQQAEADFEPLPFDSAAARSFGAVAAACRRAGRKPAARAFDALIAAIAIANGLPLYTANPADFAGIDGLAVRIIPAPERRVQPDPPTRPVGADGPRSRRGLAGRRSGIVPPGP